jgi:hypothetical protein
MNNQLYEQDFNVWRETIIKQITQQDVKFKKYLAESHFF